MRTLIVVIFTTRLKMSTYYNPSVCVNPFSNRYALYPSIVPLACNFNLNNHLHQMNFLCEGKGTRFQVLVFIRETNSILIAFFQLESHIDVSYDIGSLMVETFGMKYLRA